MRAPCSENTQTTVCGDLMFYNHLVIFTDNIEFLAKHMRKNKLK